MNVVQGDGPAGQRAARRPVPAEHADLVQGELEAGRTAWPSTGEAFGVILLGPSGAESAIEVPVRLHNVVGSRETMTLTPSDDTRLFSGAADHELRPG